MSQGHSVLQRHKSEGIFDQFSKVLNSKAVRMFNPDTKDRVVALGDGLLLILTNYSCRHPLLLTNFCNWYLGYFHGTTSEDVFLRKAKFLCCWPMAKYLRNEHNGYKHVELPEGDPPRLCGPFGRWLRSRLVAYTKENTSFFFSWFQAKRCAEPLTDSCVWSSFEKHKEVLSSRDPLLFCEKKIEKYVALIRDEIMQFRVGLLDLPDLDEFLPSPSACLEHSRDDGGQRSRITGVLGDDRDDEPLAFFFRDPSDRWARSLCAFDLVKMDYKPYALVNDELRYNACFEFRLSPSNFHNHYHRERIITMSLDQNFCLSAKIEAVLEPLKCRIISKGPAVEYFYCKRLQSCLHRVLRNIPHFRLTGQPASGDMLLDLEHDCGDYYISGDFSAATDKSSGLLGQAILSDILRDGLIDVPGRFEYREFSPDLRSTAERVFGFHSLYYQRKRQEMSCQQTRGQLMGSILSFPILCLINLIGYRMTARKEGLDPSRVLINGDDILFRGPRSSYETFKKKSSKLGLEISVGKTYLHPSYANVNSTCYQRSKTTSGAVCCQEIPYLPVNLVLGKHKVQVDESRGETLPSVAHWNRVERSCKPHIAQSLWPIFVRSHRETLDYLTRDGKIDPFLPCAFGGLGLNSPYPRRLYKECRQKDPDLPKSCKPRKARVRRSALEIADRYKRKYREQGLSYQLRPVNGNDEITCLIASKSGGSCVPGSDILEKDIDDLHRVLTEEAPWRVSLSALRKYRSSVFEKLLVYDLMGSVLVR